VFLAPRPKRRLPLALDVGF
jgi:hypothetical protein